MDYAAMDVTPKWNSAKPCVTPGICWRDGPSGLCMPEETADAECPVEAHEVGPVPHFQNASERVGQNLMSLQTIQSDERDETRKTAFKVLAESIRWPVNVLQTVCLQRNS